MAGPLAGIRVVDLSSMISGPLATMLLGDQGADVVKVEAPGTGDLLRYLGTSRAGLSAFFLTSNRGKRSLALNLREARGKEILLRLVAGADVFVQNFRPGVAERMGLGEAALRGVRPDLVYVSISGFGESGPYAGRRVYDNVVQGLSGMAGVQADPVTGKPALVRNIVADKVTAYAVAQAISAALFARERGAPGQHLRVAMLDAAIAFLWPDGMVNQTFLGEGAFVLPPSSRAYQVFPTKDGFMTAIVISDAEFQGLARALEHPEWIEDPRFRTLLDRARHLDALVDVASPAARSRTTAEWCARLDAEDVPCAPILFPDEVPGDPQVRANATLVESEHPHAGRLRAPRPAARFDRTPAAGGRPAPALGEHSDELLSELGLGGAEIDALRRAGVVA